MDYDDFLLHLAADGRDGFTVRVLRSPAGEAAARSQPLPAGAGQAEIAEALERQVESERARRWPGSLLRNFEAPAETPPSPSLLHDLEELGSRLFLALFPPAIRDRLWESAGLAGSRPDRGLRLRIQMDVGDPLVAQLHGLPWEYIFDGGYMALRRTAPIVRSLDLASPRRFADLAPPLRVLAVLSEPRDLPPLRLAEERAALAGAWAARGGLAVEWLAEPTLDGLCGELTRRPAHILHFLGHGGFDARRREGRLYFTGPSGEAEPVAASTLAVQLADFSSLRLVFLNACQTAATAVEAPFAGVATALLRTGIPAVVAMQLPIPDGAAIAFAATVYQRLAAGDAIDRAVTEGRLALHRRDPRSIAWGIPVLYLRGQESLAVHAVGPEVATARPPHGRRVGWAAAALVAFAAAAGTAGWKMVAEQSTEPDKIADEEPNGETTDPGENPPGSAEDPDPQHGTKVEETEDGPTPARQEPPPPRPASQPIQPAPTTLREGEPALLPGLAAYATADFLQLGAEYVRITVRPEGATPTFQAVMGPGATIEAPSPRGRVAVDVLAIDWRGRTVTVRGRLTG